MNEECPLDSTPLDNQYVLVPGATPESGPAFCLNCAVAIIAQAYEGGYLEGKQINNVEQLWQLAHDITFQSIGY